MNGGTWLPGKVRGRCQPSRQLWVGRVDCNMILLNSLFWASVHSALRPSCKLALWHLPSLFDLPCTLGRSSAFYSAAPTKVGCKGTGQSLVLALDAMCWLSSSCALSFTEGDHARSLHCVVKVQAGVPISYAAAPFYVAAAHSTAATSRKPYGQVRNIACIIYTLSRIHGKWRVGDPNDIVYWFRAPIL